MCMLLCEGMFVKFIGGEYVLFEVLVLYFMEMFLCMWFIELFYGLDVEVIECGIDVLVWCLCCLIEDDLFNF